MAADSPLHARGSGKEEGGERKRGDGREKIRPLWRAPCLFTREEEEYNYLELLCREHDEELQKRSQGIDFRKAVASREWPFLDFMVVFARLPTRERREIRIPAETPRLAPQRSGRWAYSGPHRSHPVIVGVSEPVQSPRSRVSTSGFSPPGENPD